MQILCHLVFTSIWDSNVYNCLRNIEMLLLAEYDTGIYLNTQRHHELSLTRKFLTVYFQTQTFPNNPSLTKKKKLNSWSIINGTTFFIVVISISEKKNKIRRKCTRLFIVWNLLAINCQTSELLTSEPPQCSTYCIALFTWVILLFIK